jgi:Amt family ammonium transporter
MARKPAHRLQPFCRSKKSTETASSPPFLEDRMRMIKWMGRAIGAALPLIALASPAFAEGTLSAGDTAWMLTSSALVLMMTIPGLALFYGGLVRSKNVLSILMQCLLSAGWATVLWVVVGYSIAFGGEGTFWGGLSKMGMSGIGPETLRGTVPEYVFAMFQLMFAIITPALMIGAFAERMRFSAWFAFLTLWLLFVYCPLAHMVWGDGGMIRGWGTLDFAGGLVVHMSSGISALVAAIYLGKRRGFGTGPMPPHSLPLTVVGTALLWVGWFGFNAGSSGAADGVAGLAFITTQTAAAAAVVAWIVIEWRHRGKPTVLGGATAAVAGLGAITPASAYVSPMGAIAVGIGAAVFSYAAVTLLKPAMGYDDSLDVFGVHGVGGTWGVLAAGIFTWSGATDVVSGQVLIQLKAIAFTATFCAAMTLAILFVLKTVMGNLRVTDENESQGLDLTEHSETAYDEAF